MLKFRNTEDANRAFGFVLQHLGEVLTRFEDGVKEMGFEIKKKAMARTEDGVICPILHLERGAFKVQLNLRNVLEEIIAVDREEDPIRVDPKIGDSAYAKRKLAEVVDGRLAIVGAIDGSETQVDLDRKMTALGGRFEHIRYGKNKLEKEVGRNARKKSSKNN